MYVESHSPSMHWGMGVCVCACVYRHTLVVLSESPTPTPLHPPCLQKHTENLQSWRNCSKEARLSWPTLHQRCSGFPPLSIWLWEIQQKRGSCNGVERFKTFQKLFLTTTAYATTSLLTPKRPRLDPLTSDATATKHKLAWPHSFFFFFSEFDVGTRKVFML